MSTSASRVLVLLLCHSSSFSQVARHEPEQIPAREPELHSALSLYLPGLDSASTQRLLQRIKAPTQKGHRPTSDFPQAEVWVIDTVFASMPSNPNHDNDTLFHAYDSNELGLTTVATTSRWINNQWQNFLRLSYTYDSTGNKLSELVEVWENGQWVICCDRLTYVYNEHGDLLVELREDWADSSWTPEWRELNTYDENGNHQTYLFQDWNESVNQWLNRVYYEQTYDSRGNIVMSLSKVWYEQQWKNSLLWTRSYDLNGNRTSDLVQVWTDSNQWRNYARDTLTYDQAGNLLTSISGTWVWWEGGGWRTDSRDIYTYNANRDKLTEQHDHFHDSLWVGEERYSYAYDLGGNLLTTLHDYWFDGQWKSFYLSTFNYDVHANMISAWSGVMSAGGWQQWSTGGFEYVDGAGNSYSWTGSQITVRYHSVLRADEPEPPEDQLPTTYELAQNYPNPFNPGTEIRFSMPTEGIVSLKVFNLLGEEVATIVDEFRSAGMHTVRWDATAQASGVYFYRLRADGFDQTRKLVLMR